MFEIIKLPDPQKNRDFPLMKALEMRRTKRKWKNANISDQELSNILWAACGITKEGAKTSKCKRTAPSARNCQSVKIYIAQQEGLFLFNERIHGLVWITGKDVRENISNQSLMKSVPVGLIYVSDFSKLKGYIGKDDSQKWFVAGSETGFISQNVYLYCASAQLSTAVIGLVNREKLQQIMDLPDNEKVIYTQAIGIAMDE